MSALANLIRKHEGLRLKPYRCPAGALTIGWGHNLDANGITVAQANQILADDLQQVTRETLMAFPWLVTLDRTRLAALLDMSFNLGLRKLRAFAPTLALIEAGDYAGAAARLRRSTWYQQVGRRGPCIVAMIETGEWPVGVPLQ